RRFRSIPDPASAVRLTVGHDLTTRSSSTVDWTSGSPWGRIPAMTVARSPRPGSRLYVKGRPLPFSSWPVGRGLRRYGLSDFLFAKSPWAVVQGAIEARATPSQRPAALAFLAQARSFFSAADDRSVDAAPLLLYYAFLNLAKAMILTAGTATSL